MVMKKMTQKQINDEMDNTKIYNLSGTRIIKLYTHEQFKFILDAEPHNLYVSYSLYSLLEEFEKLEAYEYCIPIRDYFIRNTEQ